MKRIVRSIGLLVTLAASLVISYARADVAACDQTCDKSCPTVCLASDPGTLKLTHDSILNYQSLLLNSNGANAIEKENYDCKWFGATGIVAINEMQSACYGTIKPGTVFLYPGTYCNDTGQYVTLPTSPVVNCQTGQPLINANRAGTSLHQELCDALGLDCKNFIGLGLVYPFNGKGDNQNNQLSNVNYNSGTCNPNWFGCCESNRCREIPGQCNNGTSTIDWQSRILAVLNKTFTLSMKDKFFTADVGAGLHPDVSMTRDFMITTWASSASSNIYYRVGKADSSNSTSWNFGAQQNYDNGELASLALNDYGSVFGIHRSDGGYLYVKNGTLDKTNLKVQWLHSEKWGKGDNPDIAANNNSQVIAVYGGVYVRNGALLIDGKMSWGSAQEAMGGTQAHAAINDQNIVAVFARQSDNNLVYRLGVAHSNYVEWKMDKEELYDHGDIGSVAVDNFGNVIETHRSSNNHEKLFWKIGTIDASSDKWKIKWISSSDGSFTTTGGGFDVATPVAVVSEDVDGNMSNIERQPPVVLIRMHGDNKVEVGAYRDNSL